MTGGGRIAYGLDVNLYRETRFMSESSLPADWEAALSRLARAVDARVARAEENSAQGDAEADDTVAALRAERDAARSEAESLRVALADAERRRAEALAKVDAAAARVDALLAETEPAAE